MAKASDGHSARLELRLSNSPGGPHNIAITGAVDGQVLGIRVDATTNQIVQTQVANVVAQRLGVAVSVDIDADAIPVHSQTPILMRNKAIRYRIKRLWADRASGAITHLLLVNTNVFAAHKDEHVIPADQIAAFEAKGISLATTVHAIQQFPIYRDDSEIAGEVGVILERVLLDPRARRAIHARVEDGRVEFSGLLDTDDQLVGLISGVRQLIGVRGVRSDVVVTERLATMAAAAIQDLREKGRLPAESAIEVLTEHQIIYLNGTVPTTKAANEAESAALGVAGVRIVVNNLRVVTESAALPADPASPRTHNR